uniref:Uncharacterized protein n=1 Tax=Timema tahoe TaxID=61484 RepID=A0A7R9NYP3_9NEOP|nr:unnamed protein product [Timema tahoe]
MGHCYQECENQITDEEKKERKMSDDSVSAYVCETSAFFSETTDKDKSVWLADLEVHGKQVNRKLTHLLSVPDLKRNLFSVGAINDKNVSFHCYHNHCDVRESSGALSAKRVCHGSLFRMLFEVQVPPKCNVAEVNSLKLCYERLGHVAKKSPWLGSRIDPLERQHHIVSLHRVQHVADVVGGSAEQISVISGYARRNVICGLKCFEVVPSKSTEHIASFVAKQRPKQRSRHGNHLISLRQVLSATKMTRLANAVPFQLPPLTPANTTNVSVPPPPSPNFIKPMLLARAESGLLQSLGRMVLVVGCRQNPSSSGSKGSRWRVTDRSLRVYLHNHMRTSIPSGRYSQEHSFRNKTEHVQSNFEVPPRKDVLSPLRNEQPEKLSARVETSIPEKPSDKITIATKVTPSNKIVKSSSNRPERTNVSLRNHNKFLVLSQKTDMEENMLDDTYTNSTIISPLTPLRARLLASSKKQSPTLQVTQCTQSLRIGLDLQVLHSLSAATLSIIFLVSWVTLY